MHGTRKTGLLLVALVASALSLALLSPAAHAGGDTYAAIAYSTSTGQVGHASGCYSRGEAEQTARNNCGAGDARVVVWVRNGWCALALGDDPSAFGYGWNNGSKFGAQERALSECRKHTTGAYVHVVIHSDGH